LHLVPFGNNLVQNQSGQRLTLRKAHSIQPTLDSRGELLDPAKEFLCSAALLMFFLQPLLIHFQALDPFGNFQRSILELFRPDQAALIGIHKPPPFRFNLTQSALRGVNLLGKKTLTVEVKRIREEVHRNLHAAELQIAHIRAKAHFPGLRVPSRLALRLRNVNFGIAARITDSPADLQQFWDRTRERLRQGQVFRIRPLKVAHAFFRDTQLLLLFAIALMRGDSREDGFDSRAG
jgi:hypothetical protein